MAEQSKTLSDIQDTLAGVFLYTSLELEVRDKVTTRLIGAAQHKKGMNRIHEAILTKGRIRLLRVRGFDYSSFIDLDKKGRPVKYSGARNHCKCPPHNIYRTYEAMSNLDKRIVYLYYLRQAGDDRRTIFKHGPVGGSEHYYLSGNIQHHYSREEFGRFARNVANTLASALHMSRRMIVPVPEITLLPCEKERPFIYAHRVPRKWLT